MPLGKSLHCHPRGAECKIRDFFAQYPHHLPIDDNTIEPYAMLRAQLWRDYGTQKRRGYKEKDPYDSGY